MSGLAAVEAFPLDVSESQSFFCLLLGVDAGLVLGVRIRAETGHVQEVMQVHLRVPLGVRPTGQYGTS